MKKVVIIGAGFGGLRLARSLKNRNFEIWLIDKNNYFQFQPLFYQVATAGLEPSSISFPLRKLFQKSKNVHVRCTEVQSVNTDNKSVTTSIGSFSYDYLIIATGTTTNFFGNDQIEKYALPMKSVSEALHMRNRILQNFEDALIADEQTKRALLNIVIVGGGPTGVEVGGALAEMKKSFLPKDYPELNFSMMHIYLVEAGKRTLSAFSDEASAKSREYLEKLGVIVKTDTSVKSYDGNEVLLSNNEKIPCRTLIWAAGVSGVLLAGFPKEIIARGNRLTVNNYHQVKGFEDVFAIGDIAMMETKEYPHGHPQVATAAREQADSLSKNLKLMEQKKPMTPFEYRDKGSLATIGRHLAVVDLPFAKFQGFFAWLFWMLLHLWLILGVKNKLLILVNWVWKYFTHDQSLRLIIRPFRRKEGL